MSTTEPEEIEAENVIDTSVGENGEVYLIVEHPSTGDIREVQLGGITVTPGGSVTVETFLDEGTKEA